MDLHKIAAKVASSPLSERPDYGQDSNPSLPRGNDPEVNQQDRSDDSYDEDP